MRYMPWGKHRGRHIGDVPRGYLIWLIEEAERLDAGLRANIVDELLTRICRYREPPPPSASSRSTGSSRCVSTPPWL
jgi:hypothetical protein